MNNNGKRKSRTCLDGDKDKLFYWEYQDEENVNIFLVIRLWTYMVHFFVIIFSRSSRVCWITFHEYLSFTKFIFQQNPYFLVKYVQRERNKLFGHSHLFEWLRIVFSPRIEVCICLIDRLHTRRKAYFLQNYGSIFTSRCIIHISRFLYNLRIIIWKTVNLNKLSFFLLQWIYISSKWIQEKTKKNKSVK
jgi:hypothetical protein